jgi:hypothetical protein
LRKAQRKGYGSVKEMRRAEARYGEGTRKGSAVVTGAHVIEAKGDYEKARRIASAEARGEIILEADVKREEARVRQLSGAEQKPTEVTTRQLKPIENKTKPQTLYKGRGGEIQPFEERTYRQRISSFVLGAKAGVRPSRERLVSETEQAVLSGGILYPVVKGIEFFTGTARREKRIAKATAKEKATVRFKEETGITAYEKKITAYETKVEAYEQAPTERRYQTLEKERKELLAEEKVVKGKIKSYDYKKTLKEEKAKIPISKRIIGAEPTSVAMAVGLVGAGARYGLSKIRPKPTVKIKDIGLTRELETPVKTTKRTFRTDAFAEVETKRFLRPPKKEVIPVKAISETEAITGVSRVRPSPKGREFNVIEFQTASGISKVEIPSAQAGKILSPIAKGETGVVSRTIFLSQKGELGAVGFSKGVGIKKVAIGERGLPLPETELIYGVGRSEVVAGKNLFFRKEPITLSASPKRAVRGGKLIAEEPYKFRKTLPEIAKSTKGLPKEEFYFRELTQKTYKKPVSEWDVGIKRIGSKEFTEIGFKRTMEIQPVKVTDKGLQYKKVIQERGLEKTRFLKDVPAFDVGGVGSTVLKTTKTRPVGVSKQMFEDVAKAVVVKEAIKPAIIPARMPRPDIVSRPTTELKTATKLNIQPIQRTIVRTLPSEKLRDVEIVRYTTPQQMGVQPIETQIPVSVVTPTMITDPIQEIVTPIAPYPSTIPTAPPAFAPRTPRVIPIIAIPKFKFGQFGEPTKRRIKVRRVVKYVPSYGALVFGIYGKKPTGVETGLRVRPMPKGFKFTELFKRKKGEGMIPDVRFY